MFEELGQQYSVGDFAARAAACPVEVIVVNGEEMPLSPAQTLNLYRIAQEAVANAIKHAGAGHIRVALEAKDAGLLSLTISDDGLGFDASGPFSGNGLSNMQARALELGGSISVQSAPGKGAVLRVLLPPEMG